jgi:ABC-type uncharacterized transport system substrate-binding protein
MAAELIEAKVDLIVGISSTATRALVQLTRTTPLVTREGTSRASSWTPPSSTASGWK